MHRMNGRHVVIGMIVAIVLGASSMARAQSASEPKWSAEFAIGWDNSISGNINSSAIGSINGTAVVITRNSYDDVFNKGLHLRFGGGYMLQDNLEVIGTFTYQSADADLVRMGDYGVSNLYGQYSDYQTFGLDVGLRKYHTVSPLFRIYGEGTIGLGFVDATDIRLVAPAVNLFLNSTDFYDRATAFAVAGNAGVLFKTGGKADFFAQLGLRWTSGMSAVDDLAGTGLETINDKSARWTIPFLVGVRVHF
jgi:hypothetical protein